MDSGLVKSEQEVFRAVERGLDYRLAKSLQKQVKATTLEGLGLTESDLDGDPDRQGEYITELSKVAENIVLFLQVSGDNLLSSADGSNEQPVKVKKRSYIKTFERRLHIVEFVVDIWARDNSSRIDWEQVTAEWNEAHPYDQFEKLVSLKSLFNKAIRERDIIVQLVGLEFAKACSELEKQIQENILTQIEAENILTQIEAWRVEEKQLRVDRVIANTYEKKLKLNKAVEESIFKFLTKGRRKQIICTLFARCKAALEMEWMNRVFKPYLRSQNLSEIEIEKRTYEVRRQRRIDWEQVTAEWNEAHPYDQKEANNER